MLKEISRGSFKLFLSGHGMSVKTGKYVSLAALVGVLVGFVTVAFYWMIHWAKVYVMEDLGHHDFMSMLPKGEIVHPFWTMESLTDPHRWLLVFLPAIGAILGCLLIRRFARVEHARGTDSAVKAFHRGESISRGVIPVKSVASVLTVGFGGSAGYEGPVTLLGAACGSVVNRAFRLDKRASRILMAAGLAAGIAALFRAPFAGAIFGAEIFYSSSDMEADTIMPSVVASVMSYTIFCCFYGWEPLFDMTPCAFVNGLRLLPYLVLAFVVAFGARLYISVFRGTERWFSVRTWPMWVRVGTGGLVTGMLGFVFPDILGSSYGLIHRVLLREGGRNVVHGGFRRLGRTLRAGARVRRRARRRYGVVLPARAPNLGGNPSGRVRARGHGCVPRELHPRAANFNRDGRRDIRQPRAAAAHHVGVLHRVLAEQRLVALPQPGALAGVVAVTWLKG